MIRVWDPLLRLFHWSLVVSIAIAWLTAEEGGQLHEWVGYAALALIGFRLIWGLIGPRYARFTQFIRGPKAVIGYARDLLARRERRFIGHNPLGGAMMLALLITTTATGVTGWLMVNPERVAMLPEMPALVAMAQAESDDHENGAGEEAFKEVHEMLANLMVFLIILHVGGVIYASRRHKEKLTLAMITGDKVKPEPDDIS